MAKTVNVAYKLANIIKNACMYVGKYQLRMWSRINADGRDRKIFFFCYFGDYLNICHFY